MYLGIIIYRTLADALKIHFNKGKVIVLLGPRQVGKTTLLRECLDEKELLFLDGDDPEVRSLLLNAGKSKLQAIIGKYKWVFIDETQRITDVGLIGKIITDQFKDVQLIISCSSALEINQSTQEPLQVASMNTICFPSAGKNLKTMWVTWKHPLK